MIRGKTLGKHLPTDLVLVQDFSHDIWSTGVVEALTKEPARVVGRSLVGCESVQNGRCRKIRCCGGSRVVAHLHKLKGQLRDLSRKINSKGGHFNNLN